MAFIDIGILKSADTIFAFILVWIFIYVALSLTKDLLNIKDNIKALAATMIALLTLVVPGVLDIIKMIVPWFTLGIVFITLLLIAIMALGVKGETIKGWVEGDDLGGTSKLWVVILGIIILVSALGIQFFAGAAESPTQTEINVPGGATATGDVSETGQGALFATIFHPKVLGAIFVLLIGVFAVSQLAK